MADDDLVPDDDALIPDGPPLSNSIPWSRGATDIPSDIGKALKSGYQDIKEGFFPEGGKGKQGVIGGTLATGKALVAPFKTLGEAVLDLGKAPVGMLLHKAESGIGSLINPSAKVDQEKAYEQAKEDAATALGAAKPGRGSIGLAPATGHGGPHEVAPGRNVLEWTPNVASTPAPTPPATTGVTLSEGERTGDLAARQKEVAAWRGQSGAPAQQRAKAFFEEQRDPQMAAEQERIARGMDPANALVAEEPYTSGQIIQAEVASREADRGNDIFRAQQALQHAQEGMRAGLHPNRQVLAENPHQAAEIAQGGISRSLEVAEGERAAAYTKLAETEGEFKPGLFAGISNRIRRMINMSDRPVPLSDLHTPISLAALGDLEENLGAAARMAMDPQAKSQALFDGAYIEKMRQRLNHYWLMAKQGRFSPDGARDWWGMNAIKDQFDEVVAKALRSKKTFTGNGRELADTMEAARAKHAEIRRTYFNQRQGDVIGPVIEKILGQHEGQALNPQQITQHLYGSANSDKIAGRMEQIFGRNSDEFNALRQGLFSHIMERAEGTGHFEPEQLANRIGEYTDGKWRFLTERYLSPQEAAGLRQHANDLRGYGQMMGQPESVERLYRGLANMPPNEIVSRLFGSGVPIDRANRIEVLTRLKSEMGVNAPQWSGIKQGLFSKTIEPVQGMKDWGPGKVANNLDKMLDSDVARIVYSADEQRALRAFSDLNRTIEVPQTGGNWSGTATGLRSHMRQIVGLIGGTIATAIAHGVGIPFGTAEASGFGAAYLAGKISDRMAARSVAKQLPLIAEKVAAYQKAVAKAQRLSNGTTRMQLGYATNSLANSLRPLGISWQQVQGLKGVPAQEQQNKTPGSGSDQPDQGGNQQLQTRASGGAISPPVKGARQAPDGKWYIADSRRKGKFLRVDSHG